MKAHRTTGAQTTELRHHNAEFVNDVRVSPIDEGVSASSKRTNCHVRHDDPGPEPAGLLRGHAEQHEVGVVIAKTAVTVHHVWVPGGPPSGGTLGPFRVGRSVSRNVTA